MAEENDKTTLNTDPDELKLEEAFDELDSLIGEMQGGELTLEETFEHYKRGIALCESCEKKLKKVECDIETIAAEKQAED